MGKILNGLFRYTPFRPKGIPPRLKGSGIPLGAFFSHPYRCTARGYKPTNPGKSAPHYGDVPIHGSVPLIFFNVNTSDTFLANSHDFSPDRKLDHMEVIGYTEIA
jgi:hypothetical protein